MTQQYQYTIRGISDNVQLGKNLSRIKSVSSGIQFRNSADSAFVSIFGSGIGIDTGSLSSPSFFFNGDTDTGLYSPSANRVAVVTGGASSVEFRDPSTNTTFIANGTGSVVIPVGTTAERPTTPVAGMVRYNSTIVDMEFYNGSSWVPVSSTLVGGFADGTAAAPSGYFTSDTDTGFYRPGANQFGITAGGVLSATFNQGNITTGSTVVFSGNTSLTVPVGTTAQRPTTPVAGMIRYNSTLVDMEFYNGSSWVPVSSTVVGGFPDGTAAAPGGYFSADTDTGFYRPGANQFGITAGGVQRALVTTAEVSTSVPLRAPNGTVTAPSYSFNTATNTGVYLSSTNQIGITVNGANTVLINEAATTTTAVVSFLGTSAVRIPSGTNTQRPSTPSQGMIRYNTISNTTEIYDGSDWQNVASTDGFTRILSAKSFI